MLTHPVMFAHKNPQNVLIIGGGDGGILREVLKHKSVKKAVLVDIDKDVVEVSKKFFPPSLVRWMILELLY
jgi:Spermidine synthase